MSKKSKRKTIEISYQIYNNAMFKLWMNKNDIGADIMWVMKNRLEKPLFDALKDLIDCKKNNDSMRLLHHNTLFDYISSKPAYKSFECLYDFNVMVTFRNRNYS
jgi:hypothetical protein